MALFIMNTSKLILYVKLSFCTPYFVLYALICLYKSLFLGGLSLHSNHLIALCMANYDWSFRTLPFGLFCQIWTQGTLGHILGPILVIFEICHFLVIPGPFEYFSENGVVSENQSFLNGGVIIWALISSVLGGEVPRLNHGPIYFPIQNT